MAAADDNVVDVTMERDGGQEEEEEEEQEQEDHVVVLVEQQEEADAEREEKEKEEEEEEEEEEKVEQDVVEVDGDEEQEQQQQQDEESEDDEVQFVCSVEGTNGLQDAEKEEKKEEEEEEADVVVLENGESSSGERSRANMNALMAANGYVTPATLEAELQCIICQYAMFKPVSAVCGHSFCRVCLMDSFLTRSIEEAQCPICRVEILQPFAAKISLASMFPINVTLWNLVQLLIPSVAERISSYQQEEEEDFTRKLDQLDAKWKIFNLSEQAARYHGDHDEEDANSSGRWEEDHEGHDEYPVLKVEDSQDGNLHVSRNIVLDTNDENEDGYVNMRVGISVVEFPSVFELYNEHQECSVNVIKMEEDEEMADGMPFFMNEDGDDDGFVCSSYYNEITLRVCDEGGNCVMERTRGARGGVVTFPGLRLDVPGGVYTFRFSDDLYGLKLSITTRLREPHEISDTPVADYVSLINDEAGDASRRNRRRHHDSDNEDDYDEGNESDDSFIVDDINGEAHNEEPVGRFSDDEEDHWEYLSDDEAADEEREQRRLRRQRRSGRQAERDVQFVEEHQEEEDLSGGEQETEDVDEHEEDDDHEEEQVQLGRRNVRVVEEAAFSSDAEGEQEGHDGVQIAEEESKEEEHNESHDVVRPRRRNANHILDSEDEDEGAPSEEQKEDDVSDGGGGQHDENDGELEDGDGERGAATDEGDDEDDGVIARNPSRKVSRAQWFQEDESEEEKNPLKSDVASSHEREADVPERPQKRARGRDRQVRIIDEGESDEEQEQIERSIVAANSLQGHDEEDNDEEDNDEDDSQFWRVHQFYDEEVDERHSYEDAQQDQDEEDAPDYLDEEEEQYQEEDYYSE